VIDDAKMSDLKVLRLLLELGSVSRAAQVQGCSQAAVSKALGRLRAYFDDPLLVRAGRAMRITPKAHSLIGPLAEMLAAAERLRGTTPSFDPAQSSRTFQVLVTEVGMNLLIPTLSEQLHKAGPDIRLKAQLLDTRSFSARLEGGEADLALGCFPEALGALRRQHFYIDGYVGVARQGHGMADTLDQEQCFASCEHVAVAAQGDGYAPHQLVNQALQAGVVHSRIRTLVPSFLAAAFIASRTDMLALIPARLAGGVARDMGLIVFNAPLRLRPIRIDQLWHEHSQQDPGHRWLRALTFALFAKAAPGVVRTDA
jgi:DNA-binding transcriptional LysR family regulator